MSSRSTRIKHIMRGTAPKPRNPIAASLPAFRSTMVRARKGKGSYKRGDRTQAD
jgi:hypothetical protein